MTQTTSRDEEASTGGVEAMRAARGGYSRWWQQVKTSPLNGSSSGRGRLLGTAAPIQRRRVNSACSGAQALQRLL